MEIYIKEEKPNTNDAIELLEELSDTLEKITGSSGRASFNIEDLNDPKSMFAVARDKEGKAIGCGAIRPFSEETAEVKRVYAREKSKGIGKSIVSFLEGAAKSKGYKYVCLETRLVNKRAVNFYKGNGYEVIENYGKYKGNKEAICFRKVLY